MLGHQPARLGDGMGQHERHTADGAGEPRLWRHHGRWQRHPGILRGSRVFHAVVGNAVRRAKWAAPRPARLLWHAGWWLHAPSNHEGGSMNISPRKKNGGMAVVIVLVVVTLL